MRRGAKKKKKKKEKISRQLSLGGFFYLFRREVAELANLFCIFCGIFSITSLCRRVEGREFSILITLSILLLRPDTPAFLPCTSLQLCGEGGGGGGGGRVGD